MGMAGIIQHNMLAAFGARNLGIVTDKNTKSAEKLSSGYKINRSADDAAGLSISEKMRRLIRGMDQGADNTMDGISFVQVADGAMSEVHSMLHRMNELAVQAANGTNSDSDREAINNEVEQLKAEINRIGETTMFNGETVFDQKIDPPSFHLTGSYFALEDINIYNATYDSETDTVTYGGMMLKGERISWDNIDSSMVSMQDGKQVFKGGEYTFSLSGENYKVVCKDGDEVPQLYREMTINAIDLTSIWLGSEHHSWSDFVDGDGVTLSADTLHSGEYTLRGTNQKINLFLGESDWNYATLGDVWQAKELGILNSGAYQVKEEWAKGEKVQAITTQGLEDVAGVEDTLLDTEARAKNVINNAAEGKVTYRVRAGKEETGDPSMSEDYSQNGIWLEENKTMKVWDETAGDWKRDGNGDYITEERWTMVSDSLMTWEQVGLQDESGEIWKSGTKIREAVENAVIYDYTKAGTANDTSVNFSFLLKADVTSLDSVIDGLDKSLIYSKDIDTKYVATLDVEDDSNITSASLVRVTTKSDGELVDEHEEWDLGRIYEHQVDKGVAKGIGDVDTTNGTVTIKMKSGSPHTERTAGASIDYTGSTAGEKTEMEYDLKKYVEYVEKIKLKELLNEERSLTEVVGSENITLTGDLPEKIYIDSLTEITDGAPGYRITKNNTYEGAIIDFKNATNIMQLVGTSFDATCATCNNHYSVKFERFTQRDIDDAKSDSTGKKKYGEIDDSGKKLRYILESSGQNYTMRIDLDSIREAGYTTPEQYTKAFIKVLSGKTGASSNYSDSLDFHFTQYASKGTSFYILDDRNNFNYPNGMYGKDHKLYDDTLECVKNNATFSPRAYGSITPAPNSGNYTFDLSTTDGSNRTMQLKYGYNFDDIKDAVKFEMKEVSGTLVDAVNAARLTPGKKLYEKISYGDGTYKFIEYIGGTDASKLAAVEDGKLYEAVTTYSNSSFETDVSKQNTNITDKADLISQYADYAISEMLEKSTVDFNAEDYTKLRWNVDEKPNVAISSKFTTTIWRDERQHQGSLKIHHSSELGDFTVIPKFTMNTFVLGIYGADCRTAEKATNTIRKLNKALEGLNTRRSLYGAYQNRLEHTYNRLQETKENTDAAESRIRDTDMAEEMVNQAKTNILQQAGQSMLAQANRSKEGILQLLQ